MKSRFVQVMVGILMVTAIALPAIPLSVAGPRAESANVARWASMDTWTYRTIVQNEDRTTSQGTVHITWLSDNSTYIIALNTEACGSDTCYHMDFTGNTDMSGTASGYDYTETDSNSGYYLYRVMDLAMVSGSVTSTSQVSMSGISLNCNGLVSDVTTNTPVLQFQWPITAGKTWNVNSKVSQHTTGSCTSPDFPGIPFPIDQISYVQYTYTATVQANTVDHAVYAGTIHSFEIKEVGTINRDGSSSPLDQFEYYAPTVKRHIDLTQEGEQLKSFNVNFYPDLEIHDANVTTSPTAPTQDLPAKINATVWNTGDMDAANVKVKFADGATEITTQTIAALVAGAFTNISVDWTPDSFGQHTIKVTLDPLLSIQEYNEKNNVGTLIVDVAKPLPDLKVDASDISLPYETPVDRAVNIGAKISNIGVLDAHAVHVRFSDASTQIGASDLVFDTIAKGANVTATQIWTPSTLGSHVIKVSVDPNGLIDEISDANNDAQKAVEVVQLNYSFSMTVPISQKEVKPNETAQFQITFKNTGKKQDTINVVASPPPGDWTASLDKNSILLASGSSGPVILSVTPPLGAPAGTTVNLTVQATSQGDSNYKLQTSIATVVKKMAGTSSALKTSTQALAGNPGDTVSYDFTIENTGNAPDTFTLSVDSQWATTIKGGTTTNELQPKVKQTVTLETTVPTTGMAGDKNVVTLTVKSTLDQTYQRDSTAVITCLQVYDLSVAETPITLDVTPGDSATFTIKLGNDGNGDDIVNLTITSTPDIPQDWTVSYDAKTTVKAGKNKDILVTMTTPKTALAHDYAITFNVVGSNGDKVQKPVTLTVKQVYELDLSAATPTAQVKAGKMVVLTVTVKNTGNGEDTVQMSANNLDPKLTATFSEQEFKLAPGASKDVTVTLAAKSSSSGTKPIEIKATSKVGKVSDSTTVNLEIKALPQGNNMMLYLLVVIIIVGVAGAAAVIWYRRTH
jgi:uncharacterized membrane protein